MKRCNCEHRDCHPNGDCTSTTNLRQVETFGIVQTLCKACRIVTIANTPHEDDAMWTCPTCGDTMLHWQQTDHARVQCQAGRE